MPKKASPRAAALQDAWSVLLVVGLAVAALVQTPPAGNTAASGYAGLRRLGLYLVAGVALATTANWSWRVSWEGMVTVRRAPRVVAAGAAASVGLSLFNVLRLRSNLADPLGPTLWIAAMVLLLGTALLEGIWRRGTSWPGVLWQRPAAGRIALTALLLVLAAALRIPGLGELPQGIEADEGDRAASAFDLLNGQGPPSWFDSGWFYISMIYFRLMAASMSLFGVSLVGGRMLSALVGVGFVAAVAWLGYRAFGWRVGLVATILATGSGLALQNSRVIAEAGPTALLWTVSLAGLFEGARRDHWWGYVVAGLAGGLSLYFYPSARLWAVGAALTVVVFLLGSPRDQWPRLVAGGLLAATGLVVAATPFLVHLEKSPAEAMLRFEQTTVLDPNNQVRLPYLSPPEPLVALALLQTERALGMFDRYADGGGFWPTGRPVQPPWLAALTLTGVFALFGALRDARLAVLGAWFWVGLSGVLLTVETPNVIRAAGVLPVLFVIDAFVLVELADRLARALGAAGVAWPVRARGLVVPALAACLIAGSEAVSYFDTFRTMPRRWAPATLEGRLVAELGANGPVYSVEKDEHLVKSGWVRLLAPNAQRGQVPNPGRELPALEPPARAEDPGAARPQFVPAPNQGLSFVFSGDANQAPYFALVQALYPQGMLAERTEGRRSYMLTPDQLDATRGVAVRIGGQVGPPARRFGEVPPGIVKPNTLTWSAGVSFPRSGTYQFQVQGPGRPRLRIDGVPVAAGAVLARGLHFVEMTTDVAEPDRGAELTFSGPAEAGSAAAPPRALAPEETYRLMDAPWGLLGRVAQPVPEAAVLPAPADAFLDGTVAMAYLDPELSGIPVPNTITWSGVLLAPRSGPYRMAFAAEDRIALEIDGRPVDVPSVTPDDWPKVETGAVVELTEGSHQVRVILQLTHAGRQVARWNWVPPRPDGTLDAEGAWTVVPPMVLRPEAPIREVV